MRQGRRRYAEETSGIAIVEFALIVPVLLVMLAGVVDYGSYIHERMMLEELSRNAVQYIVQGGAEADVMNNVIAPSNAYVRAQAEGRVITYAAEQKCECANGAPVACGTGCVAEDDYERKFWEVTVTTVYQPIFPYPGVSEAGLSLTGYSRLRYE
jgi:Flp pilus assembly protein TadG